ncbi:MAG: hypothetical protein IJD82_02055 [Clostridia bacterium]|nr:hypothetical protein [Clostridia bacterium]
MAAILIFGAMIIVAVFALLAYIVIKIWLAIIKSNEKDQRKTIAKTKQEGYKFLYHFISTDYDAERIHAITSVIATFAVLCMGVLYLWFSVGISFL